MWKEKIVRLRSLKFIFLYCVLIAPFPTFAGDFDGSKPLSGSVDKILEIYPTRISNDADPDTVGLPQNFFIDFKKKIVQPSKDSVIRRTSKILRVEHIENKLILQGIEDGVENVDDGLAWSIAISKKTGKVVLSASGDGVAYVVFGTCAAVENF
jgi:hypothetical protein